LDKTKDISLVLRDSLRAREKKSLQLFSNDRETKLALISTKGGERGGWEDVSWYGGDATEE